MVQKVQKAFKILNRFFDFVHNFAPPKMKKRLLYPAIEMINVYISYVNIYKVVWPNG